MQKQPRESLGCQESGFIPQRIKGGWVERKERKASNRSKAEVVSALSVLQQFVIVSESVVC